MSPSMKDELSLEKLKGVKLWITAGPREKFTASEVMYQKRKKRHFTVILPATAILAFTVLLLNSALRFSHCCPTFFQLEVLKHYLDGGGNVLVMLGEGGEMKYDTNINFLLEEFGIMVNNGAYWDLLTRQLPSYAHVYVFVTVVLNSVVLDYFLSITAADAVVRNVYYKYFHPKEALVSNGVLNRFVVIACVLFTIHPFYSVISVGP